MKKLKVITIGTTMALSLGMIGVMISDRVRNGVVKAEQVYSTCGSVKFGFYDSTMKGGTLYNPSATSEFSSVYTTDITGLTFETSGKVYYANLNKKPTFAPIRFNASGAGTQGTITFNLPTNCVGCTVYVLEWAKDSATVSVNDSTAQEIVKQTSATSTTEPLMEDYEPHTFTFSATNTVSVKGSSSKNARFYLANISFRLI